MLLCLPIHVSPALLLSNVVVNSFTDPNYTPQNPDATTANPTTTTPPVATLAGGQCSQACMVGWRGVRDCCGRGRLHRTASTQAQMHATQKWSFFIPLTRHLQRQKRLFGTLLCLQNLDLEDAVDVPNVGVSYRL